MLMARVTHLRCPLPELMIGLILPALLVAVLVSVAQRGRAGQRQPVRWLGVGFVALGLQLVLFNPPIDEQPWALAWGRWIYIASMLAVIAVFVRNGVVPGAARAPWLIAALGIALNVLVILANGGLMPQSPEALGAINGVSRPETRLSNVAPLTADTRLPWLGDIIAEPEWLPLTNVISIGDLLLAAGAAWALAARTTRRAAAGED